MAGEEHRDDFELLVEEEFARLPDRFRAAMDNVHIVIEDVPRGPVPVRKGTRNGTVLLGLYQGVPLTKRGTDYGMVPVVPDRITLFRKNIELVAGDASGVRAVVRDTLIHEIGHYFGMSEREIRQAGY
jgi:predicted Zn-dependent protease with MMP-like domain